MRDGSVLDLGNRSGELALFWRWNRQIPGGPLTERLRNWHNAGVFGSTVVPLAKIWAGGKEVNLGNKSMYLVG